MNNNSKNSKQPKITDVCIRIFSQNENKALHVSGVFNRMKQRHWSTNGKTPLQTIASKLNLDDRFVKTGPNMFRLDDNFYRARVNNGFLNQ